MMLKQLIGLGLVMSLSAPALAQEAARCPQPACAAVPGSRVEGWGAQSRAEMMARQGMVTSSQPLATQAGLSILQQGGNAIDAAVATAAVLAVVEPMSTGIASDVFMIIWSAKEKKLYALNASGTAPSGATPDHYAALGYQKDPANWALGSGMPSGGILTVTVPGTVWGWDAALKRFGTRGFAEVLAPAEYYASEGFPVSPRIAADWGSFNKALPLRACCTALDPDTLAVWTDGGRAPAAGEVFRNPALGRAFALLRKDGKDAFYRGDIARAIIAKSTALGGTMTAADLAGYQGKWVELAHSTHAGRDIYELPPPSQAWATLELLNILDACVPVWSPGKGLAALGPADPRYWHYLIEAKKLAYADLAAWNGDPDFVTVPVERLTSKAYAASLCSRVDPARATITRPGPADRSGDTVVLSTADRDGNMVAVVNSVASVWGSGLTVKDYGLILHNRGVQFSLDRQSPNIIAPGKRPYNTLAAGFVMKDGQPEMTLLLMGGDMQVQGHAQVLVNMFTLGANVQMATDMARFRHGQVSNVLTLEPALDALVGAQLKAMGHRLGPPNSGLMGGYQAIRVEQGADRKPVYRAGSDHRKDGQAAGW
ncbi:gamma-glutamyltransferase family protein [Sandarakinorhabdus oryzae]|uniref:gamma-glutamyltransferase family protein n=1 Tax=Sandarakinorhabdus oryzae TaxID=2675220 RepID=UPI0018CC30ED|nr:gamma-glutamyltransferase family protein [Sandarakinorhabdus oryzae]